MVRFIKRSPNSMTKRSQEIMPARKYQSLEHTTAKQKRFTCKPSKQSLSQQLRESVFVSLIVTPSRRTNDETEPRGRAIVFQQSEGLSGDKLKALEANISKSQTKVDTLDAKILVGISRIQQFD